MMCSSEKSLEGESEVRWKWSPVRNSILRTFPRGRSDLGSRFREARLEMFDVAAAGSLQLSTKSIQALWLPGHFA